MSRVPAPELTKLATSLRDHYLADGTDTAPMMLFVLGAAASYRSGMPSWGSIKDRLIDVALACFHREDAFVNDAWEQLAPYVGPPPSENKDRVLRKVAKTEQILGVACASAVVRKQVEAVLAATYLTPGASHGEAPQLGYELIAHFVRHGFVDHIVNFNFDEALDVALDNELGRSGYRRILSETDVVSSSSDRLASGIPHHLKLHGTISVPSSLRFTKDHTQSIPPGMLEILDQIAFEGGKRRLHLVTLGYSWNDPDFVHWVVARAELIDRVTIVRGSIEKHPPLLVARYYDPDWMARRRVPDGHPPRELDDFVDNVAVARFTVEPKIQTAIDDILWALANGIEASLSGVKKQDYVPVARHVMLGHLFGPKRQPAGPRGPIPWQFEYLNPHSADRRLGLELWLHLLKCSGMMNLSTIAETPRIQRYRKHMPQEFNIEELLSKFSRFGSSIQVRETLFHRCRDPAGAFDAFIRHAILNVRQGAVAIPTFDLESGELVVQQQTGKSFVRGLFAEIWNADETEVTTANDPRVDWLFKSPRPLPSYLRLRRATNDLLTTPWTHLFVIAESGAWLAKWLQHHGHHLAAGEKEVLLLRVADEGLEKWGAWQEIKDENSRLFHNAAASLTRGRVHLHEIELSWWRHNRHLTLAASVTADRRVQFLGGIYFRRRLKTSRIAPVSLAAADCPELLKIFLAYSGRALGERHQRDGKTFVASLLSFARALPRDRRLTDLLRTVDTASRRHTSRRPQPGVASRRP